MKSVKLDEFHMRASLASFDASVAFGRMAMWFVLLANVGLFLVTEGFHGTQGIVCMFIAATAAYLAQTLYTMAPHASRLVGLLATAMHGLSVGVTLAAVVLFIRSA